MARLMRLSEVALVLNVHIRTVYRMITDASLLAIQIRGSWRVDPSDLESYITKQKRQHAEDFGYCE